MYIQWENKEYVPVNSFSATAKIFGIKPFSKRRIL